MAWRLPLAGLALISLAGCATIPDVTASYYFPRAETRLAVTQTVGCSAKVAGVARVIRSAISVAPTQAYSSDLDWMDPGSPPHVHQGHLQFKDLGGTFTDGDATVTLTADGRLSGVNATSAGEGSAIIKDVVTIAATVAMMGGPAISPADQAAIDSACQSVDQFSAATADPAKPGPSLITMTYSAAVFYVVPKDGDPQLVVDQANAPGYDQQKAPTDTVTLVADPASVPAHDAVATALGNKMKITLILRSKAADVLYLDNASRDPATDSNKILLDLARVAMLNIAVQGNAGDMGTTSTLWTNTVQVPTHQTYKLPVPSPAAFGKTAFGLTLSDSGTIQTLHYGSNAAAPSVLDSASAAVTALQQGDTQRANDLKSQADLIAQQQRLVGCQLSPATCK